MKSRFDFGQIEHFLGCDVFFSAQVKPKPRRGHLVYRLGIGVDGLEIATQRGFHGNRQSEVILLIPPTRIVSVEKVSHGSKLWCKVTYQDEAGCEKTLEFSALSQERFTTHIQHNGHHTQLLYLLLESVQVGYATRTREPLYFEFAPISPARKMMNGGLLFGSIVVALILRVSGVDPVLLYFIAFFLSVILMVITAEMIRYHTPWHSVLKVTASIAASLAILTLFAVIVTLLDLFRL
jgi:hypothetical protein